MPILSPLAVVVVVLVVVVPEDEPLDVVVVVVLLLFVAVLVFVAVSVPVQATSRRAQAIETQREIKVLFDKGVLLEVQTDEDGANRNKGDGKARA